ncbi:MAG: phosphate ABC transporter substrate-binding protein PstS [Rhodomicrobium sp.]
MKYRTALAAGLLSLLVTASVRGDAAEVTGAGSTFVYPILSKWSDEYRTKTGQAINYQSVGSGRGIAKIKAGTADFGASDMPLKSEELAKFGMGQFPLVIGGVVPVVNLEGVQPGQIKFTGPLLAEIFLGKVVNWSDPAILTLNPELRLPDAPITIVHRTDGSGTTFNWTNYLSKVSPEWKDKVGEGVHVEWPIGAGGRGNEGVATYVSQLKYSIGYVEYAYALHYRMTFGLVQNKMERFVRPGAESFRAAAESADWSSAQDFYLVMTNAPGENAYPVTAASFILMYKEPKDAVTSKIAIDFFKWSLEEGQKTAKDLHYVPLPSSLVKKIEAYWVKMGFGM